MASIFFTGFPGFLGSEMLARVLGRGDDEALCLVQPKFRALAEERARALGLSRRVRFVEGDITRPLTFVEDVREVYHFAAVYDLSVPREVGMRVNVDGTKHVLDFARRAPRLERVHYVSTCYVSGRHDGVFREDDLEAGQTFNNFYEETKQLAELEVRLAMREGLPATIYRPSVVVGDSVTGATQKFDGPYFVIRWLLRQPRLAVLPVVGRPRRYTFNMVPRDYVIRAMDELSARRDTIGNTYALADPEPLTVDETIDAIAAATGRTILRVPLTMTLAKAAIDYVPGVYRLMQIPSAAVNYFVHSTRYDTTNARRDLGFSPPPVRDYLPNLVEFARKHPEIGSSAMV
jgi:nucleoside-diphosphate-sugar epimerase